MSKKDKDFWLSHSKMSTYKTCPRKYWYRYIQKVKSSEHWPHLVKGNFAHDVLETWVKRLLDNDNVNPREALSDAFKYWRGTRKYQEFGIEKYIDEIRPWLRKTYEDYEQRRYVPLAAEQKVQFRYRGIVMTGRIDRVDEIDDHTIKILDYKTTKDPRYLTDLQLGIYHMGAKYGSLKSLYGDREIETAYVLLRHDVKEHPYTFTVDDLDKFLDDIEATAQAIMTDETWEPKPSRMCRYCDYYIPCTEERNNVDEWW